MRVTEDDTNLRRGRALPGEFADLLNDLLGGGLEPGRRVAGVGDGRGRDTLALAVKTTHFVGCVVRLTLKSRDWLLSSRVAGNGEVSKVVEKSEPRNFRTDSILWAEKLVRARSVIG